MSTITPNTQPAQEVPSQPDILGFDLYSDGMIERVTSSVVQEKEPQTDVVVQDSDAHIYGVTSAVPGQSDSRLAAELISYSLHHSLATGFDPKNPHDSLKLVSRTAQDSLSKAIKRNDISPDNGVSSTYLRLYPTEDDFHLAAAVLHIGDGRIYVRSGPNELRLTDDDGPAVNQSNTYTGAGKTIAAATSVFNLKPLDRLVLTSTGVTGFDESEYLTPRQAHKALATPKSHRAAKRFKKYSKNTDADKSVVVVDIPEVLPPTRSRRLGAPIVRLATRLKNRRNLNQEAGLTSRISAAMLVGAVAAGESVAYVGKHRSEKNGRKLVLAGIGAVALAGLAYVAYRNWDGGINDLLRSHTAQRDSKPSGSGIGPRSPLFPWGTRAPQIPPSLPKVPVPGSGTLQPYWMNIQPGDGIESEIQDWARNMGYSGFNGRQTHQVFLETQKQFGNNLISIPGHPGPDTYTVGTDVRISAPGRGRFASLRIQSFVNGAIKAMARTS